MAVIASTSFYHGRAIVSQRYVKAAKPVLVVVEEEEYEEEEAVTHMKTTP